METLLDQISSHLQFLGYDVARDGEVVKAKHPQKLNILLKPLAGGVLFASIFRCSPLAKRDRLGYLNLINSLNNGAAVVRFYADKESNFFVEAWHPDNYDRAGFGAFMELWDRDCAQLLRSDEASRYLS